MPPGDLTTPTETLSHNVATVRWRVTSLSYGPEEYQVLYGTTETNLSMESDTVSSGNNITRTNFDLSVELTDLDVATKYYFRVKANNTVGITLSTGLSFNTTDLRESHGWGGGDYSNLATLWGQSKCPD